MMPANSTVLGLHGNFLRLFDGRRKALLRHYGQEHHLLNQLPLIVVSVLIVILVMTR
jgi:hypothetical protein